MIESFTGQYRFLSNFYPCPVEFEGISYRTVEHAFQAAKTHDLLYRTFIENAETPAKAKRLGRKAPLRENWEEVKIDVMHDLLREKFEHFELAMSLLSTGDEELVEGNWWGDTFWGKCNGFGANHLGHLLMEIREELRHGQY